MSSSIKKKAPRKFLCVGGLFNGEWKTSDQVFKGGMKYHQYNTAGTGYLPAIFVWLDYHS